MTVILRFGSGENLSLNFHTLASTGFMERTRRAAGVALRGPGAAG